MRFSVDNSIKLLDPSPYQELIGFAQAYLSSSESSPHKKLLSSPLHQFICTKASDQWIHEFSGFAEKSLSR